MAQRCLAARQALRAGEQHELARQHLGELCAGEAGIACDRTQAQRKDGGQHTAEHRPGKVVEARIHRQREPLQLEAEDILHDEAEDDGGHRDEQDDEDGNDLILPLVLLECGKDAEPKPMGTPMSVE